jgi:AraC-like DNA-binding protein
VSATALSRNLTVTEEITRQVLPTATGFAARQAIAFLRKQNVAIAPLLRRAGLSELDLDNREGRISAIGQAKLLEYAAEALGDKAFGLHLAQQANPREAGLLFYITSGAETVGETITLYARYCRIVNEAVQVKLLRDHSSIVVEFQPVALSRHQVCQSTKFMLAVSLRGLRELAGRNIRPTRIAFAHTRLSDQQEFERFFGCPVEFGATSDQGSFSDGTLATPLVTRDPHLLEMLRPICDVAARERNTPRDTLRASVENEVQKLLPHGEANRQTVARTLRMSGRSLARKLAEENTSYEQVLDELRRSLALQYIKERSISLSQIAWLLGYEGSASFTHAFVRWTGRSPSLTRNERKPQTLP